MNNEYGGLTLSISPILPSDVMLMKLLMAVNSSEVAGRSLTDTLLFKAICFQENTNDY